MELNMNEMLQEGNEPVEETIETKLNYDRSIYCADSNRIEELVNNVFAPALLQDENGEDIMFFESTENAIKWDSSKMQLIQLIQVEGLLAHRKASNLLTDMYTDENETALLTVPSNAPFLKNTCFLGGLKDKKQVAYVLENVVRVAGINIEDNNKIASFVEPINASTPQALQFVLVLIDLTNEELSNLKISSKTRKAADKVKKATDKLSTIGFSTTKVLMDEVVVNATRTAGKLGGAVVGGSINATAFAACEFGNELFASLNNANIKESECYTGLKKGAAKFMQSIKKTNKDDSYNFNF